MFSVRIVLLSIYFIATSTFACPTSNYENSKYREAMEFFTSLKSVEGLGYCKDLILPPVAQRVECGVWNSKRFRGYSYSFNLPDHEEYGAQTHYFMIGEKSTQTVWIAGAQNQKSWFTTKISFNTDVIVKDNSMNWEFRQRGHRIISSLTKDEDGNLIRFEARAIKKSLFSDNEEIVYQAVCEK
jgi:hypothetical protein